jgi:hypothetical protein
MIIETMREPEFAADASLEDGGLAASISGNADLSLGVALDRFLQSVHHEACRQQVRRVTVDLRELSFMNSSGLSALAGWVAQIRDLPAPAQYQVKFLSSPDSFWQRRSLYAISRLASNDIVMVEA